MNVSFATYERTTEGKHEAENKQYSQWRSSSIPLVIEQSCIRVARVAGSFLLRCRLLLKLDHFCLAGFFVKDIRPAVAQEAVVDSL
jgi:hypothetical protein